MISIGFKKIREVKSPEYGTEGSAGIDFFMPTHWQSVDIHPGQTILIPSGIQVMDFPPGYCLVALNKSSVATAKGLIVGAQVIDSDYRGEIHLHLINYGFNIRRVSPNEKLVQFLLLPVEKAYIIWTFEDPTATERGEGGFGSTDKP